MPLPKVSIVINTLNEVPQYLRESVRSCLKQVGVEPQVILSTIAGDPAVAYGKALGLDVVISDRKGIYYQLNNALSAVRGEWFFCFSGNDVLLPNKSINEITRCVGGKRVCYSDFSYVDANLVVTDRFVAREWSLARHLTGNFVYDDATMTRATLDEFKPFREGYGNFAYWDFWLRVAEKYPNAFAYCPKPTLLYRKLATSQHTQRKSSKKLRRQYRLDRNTMLAAHGVKA